MMLHPPALLTQSPALSAKDFTARCGELSKAKDWPGLETLARNQIATDSKDASAQAALGFALFAQKKVDEGRAACEAALKLDPKRMDALLYLGLDRAQVGDASGVKEIGNRVGKISYDALISYWAVPTLQDAVLGHADLPIVPVSKLHFKAAPLDQIYAMDSPDDTPMVVAFVIDAAGVPIYAQALSAPKGERGILERVAMHWRIAPVTVNGKPSTVRFVKVVGAETAKTFSVDQIETVRVR